MASDQNAGVEQLQRELDLVRSRLMESEQMCARLSQIERELREKEAFNFALFSYNPALTVVVDIEGRVIRSNKAKIRSGDRLPRIGDLMYRDYAARHSIDMHGELMECIHSGKTKTFNELAYGDRILSVTISPFPQGAIIISQDITAQKQAERDRIKLIDELKRALDEVQTLRGLVPICAHCKKIREDSGFWTHIENYVSKHSLADFSHTLCPECIKQYYPEFWKKKTREIETRTS